MYVGGPRGRAVSRDHGWRCTRCGDDGRSGRGMPDHARVRRKATIEPAFGVIKQVMGFRQFLLRGLRAVKGEWSLVSSAFNLKRIHRLYVTA